MIRYMKKPRLPITTYNAGLIQAQAYRALSSFMSTALRVNALSMPEWAVLGLLRDRGAVRQADLAERMAVKRPVITKGLVRHCSRPSG
jgi:DNA-binding MarR family transcriptional regulator